MRKKLWILGFLLLVTAALAVLGSKVVQVDPFFHYHKPNLDAYYYVLNNQRSQNDGIYRHFDYDAVITGSSLSQEFKTSEAEALFGHHFIKTPYNGATFWEIDMGLRSGFRHNKDIKLVIRGLDMPRLADDKNYTRNDLGTYPTYLYDDNPFNDVKYLFNRDILFSRVYEMEYANDQPGFQSGMESFDTYASKTASSHFGHNTVFTTSVPLAREGTPREMTEEDVQRVRDNIRQNFAEIAIQYPETTFYCYVVPLSAGTWLGWYRAGILDFYFDAKLIAVEELLPLENVRVFDFSDVAEIACDLNNYRDAAHFGNWVASLMLRWMHDGKYELTEENYRERIEAGREFCKNYDYATLKDQEDYENDYYAAALWREEITGIAPRPFTLPTEGGTVSIGDVTDYRYLSFSAQKTGRDGLHLCLANENGEKLLDFEKTADEVDGEWHRYLVDLDGIDGAVTLVTGGGAWLFRDTILY